MTYIWWVAFYYTVGAIVLLLSCLSNKNMMRNINIDIHSNRYSAIHELILLWPFMAIGLFFVFLTIFIRILIYVLPPK